MNSEKARVHPRFKNPWFTFGAGAVIALGVGVPVALAASDAPDPAPTVTVRVTQTATPSAEPTAEPILGPPVTAEPIERKYLLLIYNPVLESKGGQRLVEYQNWGNPDILAAEYAAALDMASHNIAVYTQADRIEIDGYPVSDHGYHYTDEQMLACLSDPTHAACHDSSAEGGSGYNIDYPVMLRQNNICARFNAGEFDEVWMFGGPWMGFWEANQAGTKAIVTNGPIVVDSECQGRLNIMGFNYERGVAEMLEDFGHRSEGTLSQLLPNGGEQFAFFTKHEATDPGESQCGNVHWAPNSVGDYDWGNTRTVTSACDDWLNYPDLTGATSVVDCTTWECDARAYHIWWLSHFPHVTGTAPDGAPNNWWALLLDTAR